MASNDLTKLTVPQLKAICKDRRITGYSKLTKNALILKLSESHARSTNDTTAHAIVPPLAPGVASLANEQNPKSLPTSHSAVLVQNSILHPPKKQKRTTYDSPRVASRAQLLDQVITTNGADNRIYESPSTAVPNPDSNPPADIPSTIAASPAHAHAHESLLQSHPSVTVLPQKAKEISMSLASASVTLGEPPTVLNTTPPERQVDSPSSSITTNSKRPRSSISKMLPSKKPKNSALSKPHPLSGLISKRYPSNALEPLVKQTRQSTGMENTPPSLTTLPRRDGLDVPVHTSGNPLQSTRNDTRAVRHKGAKFKPLIVNRPIPTSNLPNSLNGTVPNAAMCASDFGGQVTFSYLEFPCSSPVRLNIVTLPPSLSQRKRIPRWSIILSGVADEDFVACIHVSRMFRYASTMIIVISVITKCSHTQQFIFLQPID
jgi:hypothetical protein